MRQKLFTIEDVFEISGRGIIVTGELKLNAPVFKAGSKVVLIKPDGGEFVTEVIGIERMKVINNQIHNQNKMGILLKNIVSKEEVPVGTEVFLGKY